MLKDHIDYKARATALRDYIAGTGPRPSDIATWRKARDGEVCGGCKRPLVPGSFVMEAYADGSVGHAGCHAGVGPQGGIKVTGGKRRRRNAP